MKKIITLIFLFTTALIFAKDSAVITNQRVKQVKGEFIIDFNIQLNKADQWYSLAVYLSVDGGNIFKRTPLEAVSGDVNNITHSGDKKIIWKVKEEDLRLLPGDNLAFKIKVKSTGKIEEVKEEAVVEKPRPVVTPKFVEPQAIESKASNPRASKPRRKSARKNSIIVMANIGISTNYLPRHSPDFDFDDFDFDNITEDTPAEMSYGFGLGYTFGAIGFYAKFRSNFNFKIIDYSAEPESIWTTGESKILNSAVTGGVMIRILKWFQIYGGAGYGARTLAWEDTSENWVRVIGSSYRGLAIDAGAILKFGNFFLSGGVTITDFEYTDVELGIGILF